MRWIQVALTLGALSSLAAGCGGAADGNDVFDAGPEGGDAGNEGGRTGSSGSANAGGNMGRGGAMAGGVAGNALGGRPAMTAGSGGAATVPPELLERCQTHCASASEVRCPNDPSARECAQQCRATVQQPECFADFEALFDCTETGVYSCDAMGQVTVEGCELPFARAAACFFASVPDPALRDTCERYCTDAGVAQCPNAEPETDCVYGCQSAGSIVPACAEDWSEYLSCSEDAMFYCGDDGKPVAASCEAEMLRFAACVIEGTQ